MCILFLTESHGSFQRVLLMAHIGSIFNKVWNSFPSQEGRLESLMQIEHLPEKFSSLLIFYHQHLDAYAAIS